MRGPDEQTNDGVTHMSDRYRDRIVVAEIDSTEPVNDAVDIVLTTRLPTAAAFARSIRRSGGQPEPRAAHHATPYLLHGDGMPGAPRRWKGGLRKPLRRVDSSLDRVG